ncbi:SIR2 family protein [Pseudoalteromonas sp. OANN1]|uniref:SIR2 family protein n=1 Tax=Pseudoalteromonas sp. OANN1 TaxID=2954497 RepID=UPI0020969663|nr:SIR2 family protein [Pseudoalteromonas sp. OANN1]MCO7200701.1 SIR2 family protein [Pseudoalteromonas sp. OANN1]
MAELSIPQSLKAHLASNDVIPLIGAGVSMSVEKKDGSRAFPSWPELLNFAAERLEDEELLDDSQLVKLLVKKGKLQQAAQEAQEQLSGRRWYDFMQSQFAIDFTQLDDSCKALPQAIWQLSNRLVTLNYDKVLEWAHTESVNVCAFDNDNTNKLAEFTRNGSHEMLWHLHGKIDVPQNMVLTPQSYYRLYQENAKEHYQTALTKFRELLSNKILLFIGCSLNDAELLAEIVKQNQLFDGNTGPHYALVREKDKEIIEQKLIGINVELLTFSDFGQPLIASVQQLAECKNKLEQQQIIQQLEESVQPLNEEPNKYDKIGLFTASPLDKPIDDSDIIAKLKKFKHPISQQAFTESNLMEADDYSILFLLAKTTSSGLLIEDDNACSDYLAIDELESSLPFNAKITVLITDKPLNEQELGRVKFPLLVFPLLNQQGKELKPLDKLAHQLFKRPDVKHFIDKSNVQSVHISGELLESLKPENRKHWQKYQPLLPKGINASELQGFTGRLSDLADISQKLAKAANKQRLLTIKGSGGLGKTTIAKKVALELANRGHFDAGVNFIDCEHISSSNQLEMHIGSAFNLRAADDLFDHLAKHHDQRERLLIFDNLESLLYLKQADKSQNKQEVEQVRLLLSQTLMYANVLVTSRESINAEWEDVLPFRQMESEEALALFNRLTKNGYHSDKDQEFARRKILEPLLNNNPLAIKLICDGMPAGKSLKELKQELEDDFFDKVKEEDLILMFDDEVDLNINRQESLYVSILYSYRSLEEHQKRTLESFSLFPDGIDLDTFKHLITESKRKDRNEEASKLKKPISDKDIAVLTNKSLVEAYGEFYSLQSVIQRFARFRFEQHTAEKDKLELFRQAFKYNLQLMEFVYKLRKTNKKAMHIFLSLFNNLLSAIDYGAKENVVRSETELEDYFEMIDNISQFSSDLNLGSEFLAAHEAINIEGLITKSNEFRVKQVWKLIELSVRYYNGEFDAAYEKLKSLMTIESLSALSGNYERGRVLERNVYYIAASLYQMEGYALDRVAHDIKFNSYRYVTLRLWNVQVAMNVESLMNLVNTDLSYFEAQGYLYGAINLNQLNHSIDDLYENQHMERVQLTYLKSRETYVSFEAIDKLVSVNPYTRGLKKLMYAFSCEHEQSSELEHNELNENIIRYYQSALPDLSHIKFYYVQALYFYARFLQKADSLDFETIYEQGLGLTKRHYYRYWQHRFLLLKQPSLGRYKPEDYPLPGNPDISSLVEKQAKWIKRTYGTSLNPFNQGNTELKALPS